MNLSFCWSRIAMARNPSSFDDSETNECERPTYGGCRLFFCIHMCVLCAWIWWGMVFEIWPFEIQHESHIKLRKRWNEAQQQQITTIDCWKYIHIMFACETQAMESCMHVCMRFLWHTIGNPLVYILYIYFHSDGGSVRIFIISLIALSMPTSMFDCQLIKLNKENLSIFIMKLNGTSKQFSKNSW